MFIYKITNLINNKCYIGQSTSDTDIRIINHKSALKHNKHKNKHLQSSYNKHGINNFTFETITKSCVGLLDTLEIYYISKYKCTDPKYGYNNTSGGNINKTFSLESRKKLSNSLKGHTPWNKGKKLPGLSSEHKDKISKSNLGKKKPIGFSDKISKLHTGKFVSEATRAKQSISAKLRWTGDIK